MKNNIEAQESIKDEAECPIESIEQYIKGIKIDSEGKIKKNLVVNLKESLDTILKSSK